MNSSKLNRLVPYFIPFGKSEKQGHVSSRSHAHLQPYVYQGFVDILVTIKKKRKNKHSTNFYVNYFITLI